MVLSSYHHFFLSLLLSSSSSQVAVTLQILIKNFALPTAPPDPAARTNLECESSHLSLGTAGQSAQPSCRQGRSKVRVGYSIGKRARKGGRKGGGYSDAKQGAKWGRKDGAGWDGGVSWCEHGAMRRVSFETGGDRRRESGQRGRIDGRWVAVCGVRGKKNQSRAGNWLRSLKH